MYICDWPEFILIMWWVYVVFWSECSLVFKVGLELVFFDVVYYADAVDAGGIFHRCLSSQRRCSIRYCSCRHYWL